MLTPQCRWSPANSGGCPCRQPKDCPGYFVRLVLRSGFLKACNGRGELFPLTKQFPQRGAELCEAQPGLTRKGHHMAKKQERCWKRNEERWGELNENEAACKRHGRLSTTDRAPRHCHRWRSWSHLHVIAVISCGIACNPPCAACAVLLRVQFTIEVSTSTGFSRTRCTMWRSSSMRTDASSK